MLVYPPVKMHDAIEPGLFVRREQRLEAISLDLALLLNIIVFLFSCFQMANFRHEELHTS